MQAEDFAQLTTAQIAAIETADMPALTVSQLSGMSMAQHDAFTLVQLANLTGVQLAARALSTPLILDLDGNGVQTTHLSEGVSFDLNATGETIRTAWVAQGDGLLAIDRNGDGTINNGGELFGSAYQLGDGTRASDGFAALSSLDSNRDGVISSEDHDFSALRAWLDTNQDGVSQSNELIDLTSLGITSINLDAGKVSELNNGNWVGLLSSYETQDGQTHAIADVWFRTEAESPAVVAESTPDSHVDTPPEPMQILGVAETNNHSIF